MVPTVCRRLLISLTLISCIGPAARDALGQPFCDIPNNEPPVCQQFLSTQCASPTDPSQRCFPIKIRFNPGVPGAIEAIDCTCAILGEECGPISIVGDLIRCPGPCPIPPNDPSAFCQIIADGVPQGTMDAPLSSFPPGTEFECACVGDEPQGACCLTSGQCVITTASQCQGTYLGDGTVCSGLAGACCFDADGDGIAESCTVVDEECCQVLFNGSFQPGIDCLPDIPCCFPDGSCIAVSELCCLDQGGNFAPQGACLGDLNGNNIDDGCEDTPPECGPRPDGLGCIDAPCPNSGDLCLPRCVRQLQDGTLLVENCECISPNECHLQFDPASGAIDCVGFCPPGFQCQTTTTTDPLTGDVIICCECVPVQQFCPLPPTNFLCEQLFQTDCQTTDPDTICYPRKLTVGPGGTVSADECRCHGQGDPCGAVDVIDNIARCLGACDVPPNNPGDQCVIHLDGVATASPSVDMNTLPAGTVIECDCAQNEPEGACCLEDGTCVVLPASQCTGTRVYAGDGTLCQGLGACCYDGDNDGIPESCEVVDEICCAVQLSGTFQGFGTNCIGKGACCYEVPGTPFTQCTVLDRLCCDDIGGTFLGIGSICLGDANMDGSDDACVPFDCGPDPTGLACLPTTCPVAGEVCLPRCVLVLDDGTIIVDECECMSPNECHLEIDATGNPFCVGACPPGFVCETQTITTPIGTKICCRCVPDPPACLPLPDGSACAPFVCPNPDEQCTPRCIRIGPNNQVEVLDCDCRGPEECRAVFDDGLPPRCEGTCPPGTTCVENIITLPDGTVEICCDCVPVECDCPGDINGDGVRDGLDIAGFVRCLLGNPLPVDNCACADIDGDGLTTLADIQGFVAFVLSKQPCPKEEPCPPNDLLIDISTGVDDQGNTLPLNVNDDTWQVISEPNPGILPRPAVTIAPNPAWNTIPGTRWISANATGPNGEYIYEYCFCLSNQWRDASVSMLTRCDDAGEVFLNGNFIGTLGNFNAPLPALVATTNQNFFQPGINCLQVVVRNIGGVVTGFNMQGSIRATDGLCCCEPEDLAKNADTGVDDSGNLIPTGNDDVDWNVTVDASGGTVPRPATVINPNSAWLTIPGTKWIAASYTGPNGEYRYEHCFCLDKYFSDAQLNVQLRADDRADVLLNGVLIGSTPPTYSFNMPVPTTINVTNQSLFQVGENCIELVVRNTHGVVTGVNAAVSYSATNGLCCDDRAECGPTDDGSACLPTRCDDPNAICQPVCVRVNLDGTTTIIDCDCRLEGDCQVQILPGVQPFCEGSCPPGQTCVERISQNADGSIDICCDCVDTPPRGACCFSIGGCAILTQADCIAQGGVYLGDYTNCIGVQACCLPNLLCIDTDALCCEVIYGGTPQGVGSVCLGDGDGDGLDDLCSPPPPDCGPIPGTPFCRDSVCPTPDQRCLPKCVLVEPGTNFVLGVSDCECVTPNECHIEIDLTNNTFVCVGGCPPGQICRTTRTMTADGNERVCCECVPIGEPLSCCNYETGQCLDLVVGNTQCPTGFTLILGPCGNSVACCLPDGTCLDTFEACCLESGGMPQPAGVSCSDNPCGDPDCGPIAGTTRCRPVMCPDPAQKCQPKCVRVEPGTNFVLEVLDCECGFITDCHIDIDVFTNTFQCIGGCPQGQVCRTTVVSLPDGTERVCCECVDEPPPELSCCNADTGECLDLAPGSFDCPPGFALVPGPCGNLIACCFEDGTCQEMFEACCDAFKGTPLPVGVTCDSGVCGTPPTCGPQPGALFCQDVICPIAGQNCLPRCVNVEGATGIVLEIVECECVSPDECHIEIDPTSLTYQCVGNCPPGFVCRTTVVDLANGIQQVCCECVPELPTLCPIAPLQGADQCIQILGPNDCIFGGTPSGCAPTSVVVDPDLGVLIERCDCIVAGECGPIELFAGNQAVRCVNECSTGQLCQLFANGNPTGQIDADVGQFPPGTKLTCGCP